MRKKGYSCPLWLIVMAIVFNGLFLWESFSYTCFVIISSFKTVITDLLPVHKNICEQPVDRQLIALQIENDALKARNKKMMQLMNLGSELTQKHFYAQIMHMDDITGLVSIRTEIGDLKLNQAVIAEEGYLGKVVHVQANIAVVETLKSPVLSDELSVSLIDENVQIQAMIYASQDGLAKAVLLNEVHEVQEGMSVVISSYSMFPAGIPVGKVTQINKDDADFETTVLIELSASFQIFDAVCVIEELDIQ